MTDEQFKQLMDKLEELKRMPPIPPGHYGPMHPVYPAPLPWQPAFDPCAPLYWNRYVATD